MQTGFTDEFDSDAKAARRYAERAETEGELTWRARLNAELLTLISSTERCVQAQAAIDLRASMNALVEQLSAPEVP